MTEKVSQHTAQIKVDGKDVKVNFSVRLTPKDKFTDIAVAQGVTDTQGIEEVKIGQDLFVAEVGRTHIENA